MKHGTVRRIAAAKVPALYAAGAPFALAYAGHVHELADFEAVHQDAVAGLRFVLRIFQAEFAEVAHGRDVGLLEMSGEGLGDALRLDEFHQAELHRLIAVFIFGPPLYDDAGPCLKNGAGYSRAVIGEDLRHAEFDSEYAGDCHFVRSFLLVYYCCYSLRLLLRRVLSPESLDFNIHTGRQIEFHQRVHGVRRGLEDVNQPLVRAHLELLARFLVHVRRAQHRPAVDHRGQWNRAGYFRAGALGRIDNLFR